MIRTKRYCSRKANGKLAELFAGRIPAGLAMYSFRKGNLVSAFSVFPFMRPNRNLLFSSELAPSPLRNKKEMNGLAWSMAFAAASV